MDDAVKFVWAHILKEGRLTTGEWSYYGAGYECKFGFSYDKANKAMEKLRKDVISVGVDWSKTTEPKSSQETYFNGTFCEETAYKEALLGTLVLKDGSEYIVGSNAPDSKFGDFMKLMNEYLENKEFIKKTFGDKNHD